jgi:hypothetical protein
MTLAAWLVRRPTAAATARSPPSVIRTGTAGCCRRWLPGRVDPATTPFASARALADALRRASAQYEKQGDGTAQDWAEWCAEYMVSEQVAGGPPS